MDDGLKNDARPGAQEWGGVVVEYAVVLAMLSVVLIGGAFAVTAAVNALWPMVANAF